MTTDVIAVKRQTPIQQAIRILMENNITGLPVVNDDMTLVGIVSEKDILRLLYNIGDRLGKVEDFMTTPVVSFDQEESLVDVCECLIRNHFRRVPIVSKGKLVGIISRKNIVEKISRCQRLFRDTPHLENQLAEAKAQLEIPSVR